MPERIVCPVSSSWRTAGGILGGELLHGLHELVLVRPALRLDGEEHHGLRRDDALQVARLHLGAESVARRAVLQAYERADVARLQLVHLDLLVGEEAHDLHDALALLRARVVGVRALLEDARVDSHEVEAPHEPVGGDLEDERREQLLLVRLARHLVAALEVGRLCGRAVERRRKVPRHGVEERLHALVAQRGAAQHRHHLVGDHEAADRALQLVCREVAVLEVRLHHALVEVGHLLAQLGARELGVVLELRRHVADGELRAERRLVEHDGLHLDQVDDAGEGILLADWKLDRDGVRVQLVAHLLDDAAEVRAHAVHLVHEREARHVVAVRLAPDRLALRLDAAHGAEHAHRAVEDAQGTLHLHREVDVSGGVDQVDRAAFPFAGDGGGGDGDAAFALLHHPVGGGVALVDLADGVDLACVVEDALGRRRLARVDVGDDADVPHVC